MNNFQKSRKIIVSDNQKLIDPKKKKEKKNTWMTYRQVED